MIRVTDLIVGFFLVIGDDVAVALGLDRYGYGNYPVNPSASLAGTIRSSIPFRLWMGDQVGWSAVVRIGLLGFGMVCGVSDVRCAGMWDGEEVLTVIVFGSLPFLRFFPWYTRLIRDRERRFGADYHSSCHFR